MSLVRYIHHKNDFRSSSIRQLAFNDIMLRPAASGPGGRVELVSYNTRHGDLSGRCAFKAFALWGCRISTAYFMVTNERARREYTHSDVLSCSRDTY